MKTKILVPTLIVAGLSLAVASTFAATTTGTSSNPANTAVMGGKGFGMMGGHRGGPMGGHMVANLTDAEKTALESMTATEKQAFFEKKRTEMGVRRDAHEAVIDKLLAGVALSADEEKVRQEIIAARSLHKSQKTQMDALRTKIQAGTALTAEEQALVDSMPKMGEKGGKGRR